MSNIQAAQPAAHSVPNTNGGQPQYIAPIDHAQQIPASAYSHVYSNTAERSGYTMHLPQDSQIIQNRIQAGSGNHNVVTVIPGQAMQQSRFGPPQRMQMMPQGPHGHPQSQMPPFNAAPAGFYYPQNMNMVPPPTFWQYPAPTSEQAQMNPMNMNPNFNISVMMPPPMYQHQQPPMTAPTQPASQQKPREKKILMIVDPNSKQVVNENEINASKVPSSHETTENKPPSVQTSIPSTSESPNISQQFTRAVSNRLLSDKVQESDASATETRSSSVTLSVDFNDNKSETNLTHEPKVIPDYSTIPSEQLNGQFEKSGTQSLIEEELKEEQPEDGQEISEIDTARSIKEGETEGELLPTDSESKENEDTILEDLEKKMQQYYEQAKDSIDNMVYDRNFLQIIREVVSNLNKSGDFLQPLKTEDELKEMGIDQASMPTISQTLSRDRPRKEINNRNDAFKPGFMSGIGSNQQNRGLHPPHYTGRRSDKKDHRKAQVIARPSITRQPIVETLRKAENAWKPSLGKADEKEKKRKEIRGILNKITPSTFEDLKNEFIGQKLYEDESTLPMIVDLIFDKAVEEPKFVSLYSTLCKVQTEEEQKVQNSTRPFRLAIIKKCQMTFERTTNNSTEEAIENTQKEIDEENKKEEKDEKKLKELQERLDELQGKEKRRMLGTIRFIGELYRHMLITDNIIQWCAIHLIKQYQTSNDDVYIEYVVQLIETVGPIHEKRKASTPVVQPQHSSQQTPLSMSQLLGHLDQLKDQVSTRIRFAIMDLIELKDSNWVPRHGNTGPKTKEQIRNEVVQEELKNEEERKDYEKKQQQYRERDYDQRRAKPYGGRGSLDTKFVDQKRAQAAQASQATSTNLRKDVSIKSALSDTHGPLKKQSWAAGAAGGGGSIGIKQQQSQQKVIPRYAGRGSENTNRESSSLQSTSRDQHSRSSTPKQNERKSGPLMTKASSEDPALPESLEELSDITEQEGSSSQEKVVVVPEVNPEKIKNSVKSYLEEYLENHAELREASDNIKRHCTNAELTRIVFTSMFDYSVNKFKPTEDDKRRKVGEVFRRALQAKELKSDAIQGVVDFVENAVDTELDMDVPQMWEYIAFIIYTAILTDESKEEKEEGAVRPALQDFTPVFVLLANKEDVCKPFGLLILVLKGMIENFKQNQAEDIPTIMSMTFTELREADQFYKSDALAEALRSEKISIGEFENLYSLLNS